MLDHFMRNARQFARNPLGIVALFISLIYGFASLLLGTSAEHLDSAQRWLLLLFIVLFPCVVLLVFYKLVTQHHGKLYSPSDYEADDSFLRTLSPRTLSPVKREEKLQGEVQEALGGDTASATGPPEPASLESIDRTRSRIRAAEQHVVNALERELDAEAEVSVVFGPGGPEFDAAFTRPNNELVVADVKYYAGARTNADSIGEFINRVRVLVEYMSINTRAVIALVVDGDDAALASVRETWKVAAQASGLPIEVRSYNGRDVA